MDTSVGNLKKTFRPYRHFPEPGSEEERIAFREIQQKLDKQFKKIFPDKLAPRTVVVIPSLTLDQDILSKIKGSVHYEERLLCLLMLLRLPRTKVIYISSIPIPDSIIDYYLHLLPGITSHHARKRLTMLSCFDSSSLPLTQKILDRPRLIKRIKECITDKDSTHLTCYNITNYEKTLAVQLGIPLFGTDPDKFYEGSKSGGRKTFKESGVDFPDGFEDLYSKEDIAKALTELKMKYPLMRKAVIKMNDGFSGDGNAMYTYPAFKESDDIAKKIAESLHEQIKPVSKDVTLELFFKKYQEMGGIVEIFLDGIEKTSPSVQCVISPNRDIEMASTHDQLLGGDDGQIFIGAIFPASDEYSVAIAAEGRKIAKVLAGKGALGRFAIDFISVKQADGIWKHFAIEINLRKGGTTHPFLMLQFLTDGVYHADTGDYLTASGNKRFYFASDNVCNENYKGLTPEDLIDIALFHTIIYDGAAQEGVMFHLVGALSEHGKLGLVCVGSTAARAREFYDRTLQILDHECG